jgi:uncharacterized membrane protein YcaP (DUF421 family)
LFYDGVMQTTLMDVIGRTTAIYVVLYVALRLLGKREVSQFTPFDLILLLTLANAVQNAMVGDNTSLLAGIAAALTLLIVNFVLGKALSRHRRLRHWLEGSPTMLVRHGKVEWRSMQHENLNMEILMTAIRSHGLEELADVDLAVLELDGSISIIGTHEGQAPAQGKSKRRVRAKGAMMRSGA